MQRLERYSVKLAESPTGTCADITQVAELLRPIRLYHWQQALLHSDISYTAAEQITRDCHRMSYNQHMRYVQQLNEFFDVGDTAEADNRG